VGRHPRLHARQPAVVAEHVEVGVAEGGRALLAQGPDAFALLHGGQAHAGIEALPHGVVAGVAAEDEVDGRQHVLLVQAVGHLHPAGRVEPAPAPLPGPPVATAGGGVQAGGLGVGAAGDEDGEEVEPLGLPVSREVEVAQLHRAPLLDDRLGGSPHGRDPVGQLLGVRHGGRQAHQPHLGRQVDDDLLPHRAPVGVLEVVHLVEDDVLQPPQGRRRGVDHVAQDLGGHHHRGGLAVDGVVAGEQPDVGGAVASDQVAVLLVRQRLDGRRVEGLAAGGEGVGHGVLRNHCLARPGGGRHQHRRAGVEGGDGPPLKVVQLERVRLGHGGGRHRRRAKRPMRIDAS
jgi:hypothetical protein